ncbi:MAG: hypothetical protein R3E39_09600 [Anaerolineae bacterium]
MNPVELTIELPPELAQEASEFGLLDANTLIDLLRAEVDRRVMELVNAEIQDYRTEKAGNEKPTSSAK